jgi:hypothetical protein
VKSRETGTVEVGDSRQKKSMVFGWIQVGQTGTNQGREEMSGVKAGGECSGRDGGSVEGKRDSRQTERIERQSTDRADRETVDRQSG